MGQTDASIIAIGERIRVARQRKRLSQTELGRLVGYSMNGIGNIERGESDPKFSVLNKLAEALDLDLLEGSEWPMDTKRIRRRANLSSTVKGIVTLDCTVETEGLTLDEQMAELDALFVALARRCARGVEEIAEQGIWTGDAE